MISHVSRLALAACIMSAAAPAFAQAADAPQDDTAVADDSGIQDIIVTATRRETNLQKTPVSISVVSAAAIQDRKVQSLLDLGDGSVPSLRVATFEARQSALTIGIRGIVPLDANQPAREQGVGVYIDGVYLGRQHGINTALFDIERIEVLKGPQGTLFGRNTEGGALSLVTRAPSGEFGGSINGGIGNLGAYNLGANLDLPAIGPFSIKLDGVLSHQDAVTKNTFPGAYGMGYFDRKGGRIAVRWDVAPGITNDFAADRSIDHNTPFYTQLLNYNPNSCAATTTAQPAAQDVIPGQCVLPGTNFTGGLTGTVRALLPGVVVNGDTVARVTDIGRPQERSTDKVYGYSNTFKWNFGPELELRSITAWRGVDVKQFDNIAAAARPPVVNLTASCTAAAPCAFSRYSIADLKQRQFSQEIQAVGSIGQFDYVGGLYYFIENVSDTAATPNTLGAVATVTGGVVTGATYVPIPFCTGTNPASLASYFTGNAVAGCNIDRASVVRSRSYAAYGQVTWNPTDRLHVTLGGRYTKDKKEGRLVASRNLDYADPVNAAALTRIGYTPLEETWNRFNPLAIVAYDFSPEVHGYVKYATGYRAGGASSRTSNYQAFDPEDVKSYEAGIKADLFDRRVRFNLAGYIMDRKGSQVDLSTIQPTATGNFNNLVTLNAPGTTKIRGIEADVTIKPAAGLTLNASYAYTYTDVPAVPITYVGRCTGVNSPVVTPPCTAPGQIINQTTGFQKFYIVYTPRNAASASIDYELPILNEAASLRFHLDGNYSQATQSFDQFATKNDSSFLVNGRISIADIKLSGGGQKLTVGIWARNLFDNQYVYRRDPSNSLAQVQATTALVGTVGNTIGDYGNFAMPRTFGADAVLRF